MKRAYLEEDLGLIQRYFPGAKNVALRTPFDLTNRGQRLPRLTADSFHEIANPHEGWMPDVAWTN